MPLRETRFFTALRMTALAGSPRIFATPGDCRSDRIRAVPKWETRIRIMSDPLHYLELRCPACAWREICGLQGVMAWLRRMGKIRSAHEPEPDILYEVFRATVPQMTCPDCGMKGLYWTPAEDGWDNSSCCAACARPISPQRLAAVPEATLCAACQGLWNKGATPAATNSARAVEPPWLCAYPTARAWRAT